MRRLRAVAGLIAALVLTAGVLLAVGISPTGATPGNGAGNTCDGADTGAPGQGGDHTPCDAPPPTQPPPTLPPPTQPPPTTAPTTQPPVVPGQPTTTTTTAPPVAVEGLSVEEISNVLRRAFVAGESVQVSGTAPAACTAPALYLDGERIQTIRLDAEGFFDVSIDTRGLPAGRHEAEVYCSNLNQRLRRTVFWVAAAQSSATLFFVILGSAFMVYAIGWVALRSLAAGSAASGASKAGASKAGAASGRQP